MALPPRPTAPKLTPFEPTPNPHNLSEEDKALLLKKFEQAQGAEAEMLVAQETMRRADKMRSRPSSGGIGSIGQMLSYIAGGQAQTRGDTMLKRAGAQQAQGAMAEREFMLKQAMAKQFGDNQALAQRAHETQQSGVLDIYGQQNQAFTSDQQNRTALRGQDLTFENNELERKQAKLFKQMEMGLAYDKLDLESQQFAEEMGLSRDQYNLNVRKQDSAERSSLRDYLLEVDKFGLSEDRFQQEIVSHEDRMRLDYDRLISGEQEGAAGRALKLKMAADQREHELALAERNAALKERLARVKASATGALDEKQKADLAADHEELSKSLRGRGMALNKLHELISPYLKGGAMEGQNIPGLGPGLDNLMTDLIMHVQQGGAAAAFLGMHIGQGRGGQISLPPDIAARYGLAGTGPEKVMAQKVHAAYATLVNEVIRDTTGLEASAQVLADIKRSMNAVPGASTEAALAAIENIRQKYQGDVDGLKSSTHPEVIKFREATGKWDGYVETGPFEYGEVIGPGYDAEVEDFNPTETSIKVVGDVGTAALNEIDSTLHRSKDTEAEVRDNVDVAAGQARAAVSAAAPHIKEAGDAAMDWGKAKVSDLIEATDWRLQAYRTRTEAAAKRNEWEGQRADDARVLKRAAGAAASVGAQGAVNSINRQGTGAALTMAAGTVGDIWRGFKDSFSTAGDLTPEKLRAADEAMFDMGAMYESNAIDRKAFERGISLIMGDLKASDAEVRKAIEKRAKFHEGRMK